jgi:hypothetical protein
MTRTSTMFLALAVGAAILGGAHSSAAVEAESHIVGKLVCLPPNETREEIKTRHLMEPFAVLKSAQTQFKAEPLSAKLCHIGDEFVYEIALLNRDGRFVHAIVSATTGKFIEWRHRREPAAKT